MNERREIKDRRSNDLKKERAFKYNRRRFADRRLNNISVTWIPMGVAHSHPVTNNVFRITRKIFGSS